MNLADEGLRLLAASRIAQQQEGHAHFWERALSRRQFLATTGLAGGAVVTSSIWMPLVAEARTSAAPVPIPYGTTIGNLFHFLPPAPNTDDSSIFNFKGTVGVADISGPGAGTHDGKPLPSNAEFGSDNRFMKGVYIGADGKQHRGTFAFI
ncbi:MAG: twin-arginine translocation signal domain-containing protein [Chloroflexi bacterium]|nr:MAG: twin-arginine translocation signal domain-containing protein [Chloroflexota bacterium]